jgi:hypothetical protein
MEISTLLPEGVDFKSIWQEYEEHATVEAKIAHDLDKFDMFHQVNATLTRHITNVIYRRGNMNEINGVSKWAICSASLTTTSMCSAMRRCKVG